MPRLTLLSLVLLTIAACGGSSNPAGDDASPPIDAAPRIDAAPAPDAGPCDWVCHDPAPENCGATEICGNGLDDNCNGQVDEGCHCPAGAVQSCFAGPPGLRGIGACVDGSQVCQGSGSNSQWGPCTGGILPSTETCDSVDNDCNGCADDAPTCCVVALACPAAGALADGQPFAPYVIDGTQFYGSQVNQWSWTVTGGPCDQLFASEAKPETFSLAGASTSHLTFTPTLSGDYTVTVMMTLPDGSTQTCTFVVHIGGPGVRVELCWDTTGTSDLDLHLHRSGTTTPWVFTDGISMVNPDDCDYYDCKVAGTTPTAAQWGYAASGATTCPDNGGGALNCPNPRLDLDNIDVPGKPENINVDDPVDGDTFRAFVHYYGASGGPTLTHPLVNIYCGGHLEATYGAVPDQVAGFDGPAPSPSPIMGPMWRVADITAHVTDGVTTDCTVTQLHAPAQTSGYWVANDGVLTY